MAALGEDVQRNQLKLYAAFNHLKNFATVVPQKGRVLLYVHPSTIQPLPPNARDVSQQGHWGTGYLELTLTTQEHLDAAKPLIATVYEGKAPPPPSPA